jgi:hypothetical protein
VLTDREQKAWREIQRRLVDDPDFRPTFHPIERPGPGDHHRPTRPNMIVVALTLVALLLIGPNLLTDAEIADRRQPPRPDESPAPAGLDPDAYAIGMEWAPAPEFRGLVGPTDIPRGRRPGVAVSTPPRGSTPSAAALTHHLKPLRRIS